MNQILIGTMNPADQNCVENLRKLINLGFESFTLNYWSNFNGVEPEKLAEVVRPIVEEAKVRISAISLFCNPMLENEAGEIAGKNLCRLIDCARDFGCDIVSGFTGRLPDVAVPENIARFKAVWLPLAERAAEKGVRIAWENCSMGGNWEKGDWNIAHNPDAWELMFDAIPLANVGLEWEPCHQLVQLIQPLPQIREWKKRFFHIHGKDATVRWDLISRHGIGGSERVTWHRTPGFGDTNWTDIISELRMIGYQGAIDIEGWHDPVYRNELEMTGQVHALNYLKQCRGGDYIEF